MWIEGWVFAALAGLLTLWVVLPLIPAVLIYWLFPNTSVAVSGPLANLTVRATGAFAAYLVVFAVTIPLVEFMKDTAASYLRPFWTVKSSLAIVRADGREVRSKEYYDKLSVLTRPDPLFVDQSTGVELKIVDWERTGKLPKIIVRVRDFGEEVIDLKKAKGEWDHWYKTIEMKDPIKIRETFATGVPVAAHLPPRTDSVPAESSVGPVTSN